VDPVFREERCPGASDLEDIRGIASHVAGDGTGPVMIEAKLEEPALTEKTLDEAAVAAA
jgi:hypothetical protein